MRKIIKGLVMLLGLGAVSLARADGKIYLCVDANGNKELTDVSKKGNCKALDLPGSIAAPVRKGGGGGSRSGAASPPPATPSDFPKVDSAAQKARDNDRRQILFEELKSEEQKLNDLRKEFNGGEPERSAAERSNPVKYQERVTHMKDNIGRLEKNLDALKREISNIK